MSFASHTESHAWWSSLRHEGLLLDESRLRSLFPDPASPLSLYRSEHLRKALVAFQATPEDSDRRTALVTCLLQEIIGLGVSCGGEWQRGSAVPPVYSHRSVTGEVVKPAHLFTHPGSPDLPVFTSPDTRLGVGKGKRTAARVIEWMRAKQHRLALLTNGHQWRIFYAHSDSSAWCESDSTQWFIEGQPAPQLEALRLLLDPRVLLAEAPDPDKPVSPILTAIEASRRGQSELSAILGERVRLAVEKLIASHGPAFLAMEKVPRQQDIYVAACRVVLRLVFTLFAEARDLLPRSNPVYWQSYSLGGLIEQLLRIGAGSARERLRHRFGAWPRLLALSRLVHEGSPHEALPLVPYGGELFSPGQDFSTDGVSRALAVFESACFDSAHRIMSDSEVLEMLTLITRTQTVIRQGRGRTTVTMPVDFSDLSSEYIGILYEGLLDYELRCVSDDEAAVLFLAIGHEPALPLARLEQMGDADLKGLVDAFKKAAKAPTGEGEEEDGESEEEDAAESPDDVASEDEADVEEISEEDIDETLVDDEPLSAASVREQARQRALAWARRAVVSSGLVPKPKRGKKNAVDADHQQRLESAARAFIRRLILPGEWYLVRWGGTRKGSGSFYTRPGLALPTIRRTLEPLVYERGEDGTLIPRTPQQILALKTCDPACGSGTFPVGTLRYLAEALFQSVFHHGWLVFAEERQSDGTQLPVIKPGPTSAAQPVPAVLETLLKEVRLRAIDDESRLRAWLKRLIVENCLYGVDLDPLAIELARLALWVETMDPSLPFTFLDHKFRCGNGLVGAWLDTFQHYPVMSWTREGGDKNHTNFHHHFREKTGKKGTVKVGDVWTEAIKQHLDTVIRPGLRTYIEETAHQNTLAFVAEGYTPAQVQEESLGSFNEIHRSLGDPEVQREAYRKWSRSYSYLGLRDALDRWCALWFWPADRLELAPTPADFHDPSLESKAVVRELREEIRFFHWELEFPDVFNLGSSGFDAVLGNPPWETIQPMSKEWFSNIDPFFRSYGKQAATGKQNEFFAHNIEVEQDWINYNSRLKALGNFGKYAAYPFGDPESHENKAFHFTIQSGKQNAFLHARWRPKRKSLAGFADPAHPFRHQGEGKPYLQKLFTEQAHALLRSGGRLGFIIPSGIYSDKGCGALRTLFLDHCHWEWCFGFENRDGIFGIHRSFKFVALLVEKGGKTDYINTAFMRRVVDDWDTSAEILAFRYTPALIEKFSPTAGVLLEIRDRSDVEILEQLYSKGVLLGDESELGWGLKYAQGDFNMASDSKLFPPISKWEASGYQRDEYGHWVKGNWQQKEDEKLSVVASDANHNNVSSRFYILESSDGRKSIQINEIQGLSVPLYEGVMTWQFNAYYNCYTRGSNTRARWERFDPDPFRMQIPRSQYLIDAKWIKGSLGDASNYRIAFRAIQNASNQRTFIGSINPGYPAGHSLALLGFSNFCDALIVLASACSFLTDWVLRPRMSQANLSYFVVAELPLLSRHLSQGNAGRMLTRAAAALSLGQPQFSAGWLHLRERGLVSGDCSLERQLAVTEAERLRQRCVIDALCAYGFGLSKQQFSRILVETDFPSNAYQNRETSSRLDPKGFWRVDKEKDPELRHTVLAQVAFADLISQGLDAFLIGPDGDGWQLPETLRLADYGLGHDDRALEPQPVASRLGPRFLDWQLAKDPAQSWAECEAHAAQLDALWKHARSLAGVEESGEDGDSESGSPNDPAAASQGLSSRSKNAQTNDYQPELF